MSNQKADAVAVCRLETRIDPRANIVPLKPPVPCNWDDNKVVHLRQDGPWDMRELLFVGLSSELKPISAGVEVHDKHAVAQKLHA